MPLSGIIRYTLDSCIFRKKDELSEKYTLTVLDIEDMDGLMGKEVFYEA